MTSQQATGGLALFDREDPESRVPDDARHWISVYQSLIDFCDALQSADNPSLAQRRLLREHRQRFQNRIVFWLTRLRELDESARPDRRRPATSADRPPLTRRR
jgi:hypothetical protein